MRFSQQQPTGSATNIVSLIAAYSH